MQYVKERKVGKRKGQYEKAVLKEGKDVTGKGSIKGRESMNKKKAV